MKSPKKSVDIPLIKNGNLSSAIAQNIIETVGSLVLILNTDGKIAYFNKACQKATGYKLEEVKGEYYWEIFLEDNEKELLKAFFYSIKGEDLPLDMEIYWKAKGGGTLLLLWTTTASYNKEGEIDFFICSGIDITKRKQTEEKLRETNEKLTALIHASPLAVLSLGKDLRVTSWNAAAERIFGWSSQEVIGSSFPFECKTKEAWFYDMVGKVLKGRYYTRLELSCHRKNGEEITVSLSPAPIRDFQDSVVGIMIMVADITDLKKAEAQLKYLSFHDKLTGLYNRLFFEKEVERLNTERQLPLSVIMGDANGLKLVNDTFGHQEGDKLLITIGNIIKKCCRQEDIVCRWGGDEFAILLPNTDRNTVQKICKRIKKACAISPASPIQPSISLGSATKTDVEQFFQDAIKKAEDRMYRNKFLENKSARSHVISSLTKSLAEKTSETEEHAVRLQDYSLQLGIALGLSIEELDELTLLATLHDIGKIAVPDDIINKPGPLSPEEWKTMKGHCESGYRIVQTVPELAHIAEKILSHHERWDGKGYPRGLKGETIPLLSRIVSIADAYDAMTGGRPYKKPMQHQEAVEELKRCSGTQFDPKLVKKFVELIKEK